MRISPYAVPRTFASSGADSSWSRPAGDHEITPECLAGCLTAVIPCAAFRAMARALTDRYPSRVFTVGDVLVSYRTGEVAGLPGLGRCSYAGIENGLYAAALISRSDRPAAVRAPR